MESILVGVNNFFAIFSKISSFLWSFPTQFSGWKSIPVLGQFTLLVLLLLGAGIWFTIKTGFVQIKNFKKGIKILSQKKSVEIGISPFASFMLSSAMRIGARKHHRCDRCNCCRRSWRFVLDVAFCILRHGHRLC